jgi:hypothetical protein
VNALHGIRTITPQDLALLGMQSMAYLRAVTLEGTPGFGIFAADGTKLAFAPTRARWPWPPCANTIWSQ